MAQESSHDSGQQNRGTHLGGWVVGAAGAADVGQRGRFGGGQGGQGGAEHDAADSPGAGPGVWAVAAGGQGEGEAQEGAGGGEAECWEVGEAAAGGGSG